MGEPGRFLELASIDNNVFSVDTEVLENLFEISETEGALVAIVTVLGSPRSGKSKLLGQMLKYLQNENKITVDEETANKILTFGDTPNKTKKCIITWSKPMFVLKGVKKRVAVYLLDVKGNFMSSSERDYIMLSGLCTCISSTTIYLHGDHISDVSWKHLTSVTAEGLRSIDKQLIIHQNITFVIQNWTKPQEYMFGDKDSDKFCKNLKERFKNSPREKIFLAYEQFQFFLLPEESSGRYSSLFKKLLTITLDSSHIVEKRFGCEANTLDIITYIKNHIEEVNYNDDFSDNLEDFKCLSGQKQTNEKRQSLSIPKSPIIKSPSFFDIVNKLEGKDDIPSGLKEEETLTSAQEDLHFGIQLAQKGTSNQEIESAESEVFTAPSESRTRYDVFADENTNDSNNSDNDHSNDGDIEMTDVSNVMQEFLLKGLGNASNVQHDFEEAEEFDYSKYLENFRTEFQQNVSASNSPSPTTTASTLSPAETLKNMATAAVSEQKTPVIKHEFPKIFKPSLHSNPSSNISDIPDIRIHSDVVKEKPQDFSYPVPEKKAVDNFPRIDTQTKWHAPQMTSATKSTSASEIDQSTLEDTICQVFGNCSLSENKSSRDILNEVNDFIGSPENKKIIFQEDANVNKAIDAVLKYIEEMEKSFQTSIHMNETIFQNNHERCLTEAMKTFDSRIYLQSKVTAKIVEAKDYFCKHNSNIFKEKTKIINAAVRTVKAAYEKDMEATKNSVVDDPSLLKIHDALQSKLIGAIIKTCHLQHSPILADLQNNIELELKRLYDNIHRNNDLRLKTSLKKIDTAAMTAKMYYETEMNGPVRLGVYAEKSQLQNLHETKFSEAKRKFDQLTSTIEVTNLVEEKKRGLEIEILECYSFLTLEFEEKLKQNPPKVSNAKEAPSSSYNLRSSQNQSTQKVNMDHGISQYSEEHNAPKPEYGLGIYIETNNVTVSIFCKNKIETQTTSKNLVIGYNGEVCVGSTSGKFENNHIKLSSLFEGNIAHSERVKWNGEECTFRMEECLSLLFSRWKYLHQSALKCIINVCVIAVPSFLGVNEMKAVYDAALIAGFQKIHILRDICSAAVGFTYFSDKRPGLKDFILINTTYEKWDAGYYDTSKSLEVKAVSGDNYVGVGFWSSNSPENRINAFISNIVKFSCLKDKIDVILIDNEKSPAAITAKKTLIGSLEKVRNVFVKDKQIISQGCAFMAALLCGDISAQNRWKQYHPNSDEVKKYHWSIIDQSWSDACSRRKSKRYTCGNNLKPEDIDRLQKKIRKFVTTREDATAEANSFLLSISKKIQSPSVSETARFNINRSINDTFKLLRDKHTLVPDIDRAVAQVQENYDKYTKPY